MARIKKENPEDPREFTLLDLKGNEINVGDSVVIGEGTYYGSGYLVIGMIREIKKCPKIVKIYHSISNTTSTWSSYVSMEYSESNTISNKFLKLSDIAFDLDKKNFARLFVDQKDFISKNPDRIKKQEAPPDETDEE